MATDLFMHCFATLFHLLLWTAFLGTLVALLMRLGYTPVLPRL
jgi:hypothetical protein